MPRTIVSKLADGHHGDLSGTAAQVVRAVVAGEDPSIITQLDKELVRRGSCDPGDLAFHLGGIPHDDPDLPTEDVNNG